MTSWPTRPKGSSATLEALPKCRWKTFIGEDSVKCPVQTQVGYINLDWIPLNPPRGTSLTPLYLMEPTSGHVAELGFSTSLGQNRLVASVRPGDNGIRISSTQIPQGGPLYGAKVTIWGVPGDPAHDHFRDAGCQTGWETDPPSFFCTFSANKPFGAPIKPFLDESDELRRTADDDVPRALLGASR